MTTDALVTSDLAALATDNRRGLPSVALAAPPPRAELDVLVLSRIFVRRVATIASALTVLGGCVALLVIAGGGPFGYSEVEPLWFRVVHDGPVKKLVLVALAVRGLVAVLAMRAFERKLRAGRAGMRLVQALDGWSVALGIAGHTAVAVMLGAVVFVVGDDTWVIAGEFKGISTHAAVVAMLWQTGLALALALGAAIAIGRAHARNRRWISAAASWWVAVGGVVALLVTCMITSRVDAGDLITLYIALGHASVGLRLALTLAGTISVVAIATCLTLRRQRRELDQVRSIT